MCVVCVLLLCVVGVGAGKTLILTPVLKCLPHKCVWRERVSHKDTKYMGFHSRRASFSFYAFVRRERDHANKHMKTFRAQRWEITSAFKLRARPDVTWETFSEARTFSLYFSHFATARRALSKAFAHPLYKDICHKELGRTHKQWVHRTHTEMHTHMRRKEKYLSKKRFRLKFLFLLCSNNIILMLSTWYIKSIIKW